MQKGRRGVTREVASRARCVGDVSTTCRESSRDVAFGYESMTSQTSPQLSDHMCSCTHLDFDHF